MIPITLTRTHACRDLECLVTQQEWHELKANRKAADLKEKIDTLAKTVLATKKIYD